MRAADPEHVAFAGLAELLFDIANAVDRVTGNPLEWHGRRDRAGDHCPGELRLGCKADIIGHVCGFQAVWIVGPFLRKIQCTIDEGMTVARNVGGEDANLTVRDLARRTSVLPGHAARCLALLEKTGLVDHQNRIVIRQVLNDIVPDDVAQVIGVPISATQDCLLPPRPGIASRLRSHPTRLAGLIAEQPFQEQSCIRRHALLPEQPTYPLLDLSKRCHPQSQRLLDRRRAAP